MESIGLPAGLPGGEGEHREVLAPAVDGVVHIAGGHDRTAVEGDAHAGVKAGVPAGGAGGSGDIAAVDHQPAVGVDAVTLPGLAGDPDVQAAAVDGGDGHVVLIGVDAVVAGGDVDGAAVDGEMELRVQALVVGGDVQHTGAGLAAVHIHAHLGVEGAVILVELLAVHHFCAVLTEFHGVRVVDPGHVGAGDVVDGAVGDENVGAGGGGVHGLGGGVLVIAAALIDVVEDHRRGHAAGDVHAVQDQRHHRRWVLLRVLSQVHGDLPGGEGAAEDVSTGLGDVDHCVGRRLVGGVGVGLGALAVGEVAARLIADDVMGGIDGGRLVVGDRLTVHGDAVVRQDDGDGFRKFLPGRVLALGAAAGEGGRGHCQAQKKGTDSFHHNWVLSIKMGPV